MDHESFLAIGVAGNNINVIGGDAKEIFAGDVRLFGVIREGFEIDPRFFGIGRTVSYFTDRDISGRVRLTIPPGMPQAALRRGKVRIEHRGPLTGSFEFSDGATGHGGIEVIQERAVEDVDIIVTTDGETGTSSARVEIAGPRVEDVTVRGLPSAVRLEAGRLVIRISADLSPDSQSRVLSERISIEMNRDCHRHPWH
jgi:hypothetical protein